MISKLTQATAILFALSVGLALSPAHAAACQNALTTYDQLVCLGTAYQVADDELNAAYKARQASRDEQGRALLRNAQRAWISFRDKECTRQADTYRGGTLARVVQTGCLAELTEQRASKLSETDSIEANEMAVDDTDETPPYWHDETLAGKFDCQNNLVARLGIMPSLDFDSGKLLLTARLTIGDHNIDIPIDHGGDSLCGHDLWMSITDPTSSCPGIRVDDGMCDAFRFSWNEKQGTYQYERN